MALDRDFKVLVAGLRIRFTNNHATDALEEGDGIVHSSGVVAKIADSCTTGITGVCVADVANGDQGELFVTGVFRVSCAASQNFEQFGAVYAASASTVDTGSQNDVTIGYVCSNDPADGASTIEFFLVSHLFTATTHA